MLYVFKSVFKLLCLKSESQIQGNCKRATHTKYSKSNYFIKTFFLCHIEMWYHKVLLFRQFVNMCCMLRLAAA